MTPSILLLLGLALTFATAFAIVITFDPHFTTFLLSYAELPNAPRSGYRSRM